MLKVCWGSKCTPEVKKKEKEEKEILNSVIFFLMKIVFIKKETPELFYNPELFNVLK